MYGSFQEGVDGLEVALKKKTVRALWGCSLKTLSLPYEDFCEESSSSSGLYSTEDQSTDPSWVRDDNCKQVPHRKPRLRILQSPRLKIEEQTESVEEEADDSRCSSQIRSRQSTPRCSSPLATSRLPTKVARQVNSSESKLVVIPPLALPLLQRKEETDDEGSARFGSAVASLERESKESDIGQRLYSSQRSPLTRMKKSRNLEACVLFPCASMEGLRIPVRRCKGRLEIAGQQEAEEKKGEEDDAIRKKSKEKFSIPASLKRRGFWFRRRGNGKNS